MMRAKRTALVVCAVIVGVVLALTLTQGRPGVVIAVDEKGMATIRLEEQDHTVPPADVKIGDKHEHTVPLPGAKVGDRVVCVMQQATGKWECTVHNL